MSLKSWALLTLIASDEARPVTGVEKKAFDVALGAGPETVLLPSPLDD